MSSSYFFISILEKRRLSVLTAAFYKSLNFIKEYSMKNVLKTFGIIALAAIIGVSMVAYVGIYEKID